ncbi:hypothetical protein Droror1_Dr00016332, partial [Drosera rotundifolia]
MAALHMKGKAERWYFAVADGDSRLRHWVEFSRSIVDRFGEKVGYDKVEEFTKMRQWGKVEQYTESFKEKRYDLLQSYPYLDEAFFVSSYISGLKEEIRPMLKMMAPTTPTQAYTQAKLQEWSLETMSRRGKSTVYTTKTDYTKPKPAMTSTSNKPSPFLASSTKEPTKPFTKGTCFKCQEKWALDHGCKQLRSMEVEEEEEYEDAEEEPQVIEKDEVVEEEEDGEVVIEEEVPSVHALSSLSPLSTIRIRGRVGKMPIHILVDSG